MSQEAGGASYTPRFNIWLIAVTVTLATFMEVLDTSIANVALPHIAGSLSVSNEESTWILTSYLVANAVVLPLSGWLSGLIGRKRFYLTSVCLFTISSALCGMATSIEQLVFFRVLQGLGGGGLQPSEQAILMDTFPLKKRGMAMAIYGMAVLCAPVLGPTLGGYITDNYSWRWIFYINLPVGVLSLILTSIVVEDPPFLTAMYRERRRERARVDVIGLSLLTIGLASLEIVLDKGETYDWFGSPFIVRMTVICVASLVGAVLYELWHPNPIVNLRLFKDRNFAVATSVAFFVFAVVYGSTMLLPQLLQLLMGYTALNAGLVLSPAGLATIIAMPFIGLALTKGVDARWLMLAGLVSIGASSFWMAGMNIYVAPGQMIWPRNCMMLGAAMLFVPLSTAAYTYLPKEQTNNASGLFNLFRNEGGSVGVSLTTTLLRRQTQFHHARLAEHVDRFNPITTHWLGEIARGMQRGGSDTVLAGRQALRMLEGTVTQQAAAMAYFDLFWLYAVLALAMIPLIFLMKRSVSEGGALAVH